MINAQESLPKISCLMVTANNRFDYFKKSVQCYVDQTYPNRELVIVTEAPRDYQKKIKDYLSGRDDVHFVFLNGWYSLGALRNISMSLCYGDVFVQWDDDDFNAPERLAVQYSYLSRHPKARVCFLSDQLHYYFNSGYLFWEDWAQYCSNGIKKCSLIPGTIMAYRRHFHNKYPSAGSYCSAGEDSVLTTTLCENDIDNDQVVLMSNYGYVQMYTFHGNNVWDEEHHLKISKNRSLPVSYINKNRQRICDTINYLELEGTIKVMGREGLAFTHEV
jgi:glycosyltransferase involved in cell wall biosynthesis